MKRTSLKDAILWLLAQPVAGDTLVTMYLIPVGWGNHKMESITLTPDDAKAWYPGWAAEVR